MEPAISGRRPSLLTRIMVMRLPGILETATRSDSTYTDVCVAVSSLHVAVVLLVILASTRGVECVQVFPPPDSMRLKISGNHIHNP